MRLRSKTTKTFQVALSLIILIVLSAPVSAAEAAVNLGSSENFAVLAGSTLTNTGSTVIGGDFGGNIGVSPGNTVTGFPPGLVSNGTIHTADAIALQAQLDVGIAYDDAAGRTVTADLTDQNLGGLTLTTGVYSFSSSAQLTGTLVLDGQGDPEAVFIFQIGSTLTTAPSSSVSLINGARFCRVFWQVGSSATLGTNTNFTGHIIAFTSITAQTGVTMQGQLLARNGAVTLDSNNITNGVCAIVATPEPTATPTPTPSPTIVPTATPAAITTPEPTAIPTPMPTTINAPTLPVDNAELPDTGEPDNYNIYFIILATLAGLLAFYYWRRKTSAHRG